MSIVSIEILQEAAKIVALELVKAEEKIFSLNKELENANGKIALIEMNTSLENLPGEIWKDIKGYEGLYQVSNKGRVKSFHRKKIKLLKRHDFRNYYAVRLYKDGIIENFLVHRLVAEFFIPNPQNKPQVNHKDGNKLNNCVENLEWVTIQENLLHAVKIGLHKMPSGLKSACSKLTAEDVRYIRKNYIPGDKNFSRRALSKKFNVCLSVIQNVLTYKTYKDVE